MNYHQYQHPNPNAPQPKKGSNTLLIVLGIIGFLGFSVIAVCCGGAFWLASFPSVSASATQPFELHNVAIPNFPAPASKDAVPGGGERQEIVLGDGTGYGTPPGSNGRMFVYRPTGAKEKGSLPCVLICGAGSTGLEGMKLGDADAVEHLPYVKAGFVVVAYELDGANETGQPEPRSYNAFREAQAGLVNAKIAFEYASTKIPEVDSSRIFAAGHSSAGTVALLFAAHEPDLAGCVAYAPCTDFKTRIPAVAIRAMSSILQDLPDFIVRSSPRTHEGNIQCPVMVFHATDDTNVPVGESRAFVDRLSADGVDATFAEVPTGDHYQSMIDSGIPAGIEWMKQH